ncbi:hypothetical protein TraAM80_07855 [Trypanosoma rangeli]|uniref:Uncharacterized protein n=1 Tax=Trypanosoma rangeli TaxID=5698 RepID=A0A3R7M601_TRYRA|nr:uncharacterized protein TraAM80_07855 [Trypanosoma rangeli]RNF00037.1 hypothetical protein TraAM80_07855 [Trypanosoma rangeli]|eukprot:RNF00037.1 hypothetical protein TraAM80_07855 [Trypanosoma rangeli]
MDVEDVISRHRARLEEYRKFLDTSEASSTQPPKSPNGGGSDALRTATPLNAVEGEAFSPLPVRPGSEARGGVLLSPCITSISPVLKKTGCVDGGRDRKLQRGESANNAGEERRLQWPRELNTFPGSADPMPEGWKAQTGSRGGVAETHSGAALCRAFSGPAVALSGKHRNIHDWLTEEERFFNAQVKAAGRYYVTRPDAMYAKSQLWLEGRERSLQQLQQEFLRDSLEECSFQPQVATLRSLPRWRSSTHADSDLCEDPSVVAHLERMEEARQLRAKAERRLKGSNAGTWTNSVTVPRQFEFAKKVAVIPSLRKPLLNVIPLYHDKKSKEGEASHTDSNCAGAVCESHAPATMVAPSQREPRDGGRDKEEEEEEAVTAVGGSTPNVGENGGATVTGDTAVSQLELVSLLEATVAHLKEELANKEQLLQTQRRELALLSRELEVAKATVRRLSLQDVVKIEEKRSTTPDLALPLECEMSGESNA